MFLDYSKEVYADVIARGTGQQIGEMMNMVSLR